MLTYKNVKLDKIETGQKGKVKYLIDGKEYFAEEAAIKHYEDQGYKAIWSENSYWWEIMSLLFWDIIFAKICGAVSTGKGDIMPEDEKYDAYFQQFVQINGMPADFFTPDFYARRKQLINNRLQELHNSDISQKISESFNKNHGKKCRPIENWNKYKLEELLAPIQTIDKEKLLKILERLIGNFNDNRAGLPDLIVYNDSDSFFVEVKAEKDKISEVQQDWHDYLSTTLGFKVEIFLINQSDAQINKAKNVAAPTSKEVTITFGDSSSKKREEAIKFIKDQPSFFTKESDGQTIYGAKFEISESGLEKLFNILDLTSGWKTQNIVIDKENVSSTELRSSLWCFRNKVKQKGSSDYCKTREYDNKHNPFGCRAINLFEFDSDEWRNYGYIDTAKEEWVFDKNKIQEEINNQIARLKYCPLLKTDTVTDLINDLPGIINPKIDTEWAFVSNDFTTWFWRSNKWVNTFGDTKYPGINLMVGVKKLKKREIDDALRFSRSSRDFTIQISSSRKKKQASGCFIATAVYGSEMAYEVCILRGFRDQYLLNNLFGRLFVRLYYWISPSLAVFIRKQRFVSNIIRTLLDRIVVSLESSRL